MSDSQLSSIWSSYVHSPHGTPTLRDSCAALLSYSLSSSQLIPSTGGTSFPPQLIDTLSTVLATIEALSRAAAGRRCLPAKDLSCQSDLHVLRCSRSLCRIALTWILLLQQLANHMEELERLCAPSKVSRSRRPSRIPHFVESLCPELRAALPRSVFELFHIPPAPGGGSASRKEVHSRETGRIVKEVLDNSATRRATARAPGNTNPPVEWVAEQMEFAVTNQPARSSDEQNRPASLVLSQKEIHLTQASRFAAELVDNRVVTSTSFIVCLSYCTRVRRT
ncbi:hypothetical protein B0H15DRAFT_843754 [Mycena belliarum]|uniref:Uncharacterized protein n=1 Tax=Mycena belliarum TaxID=1033014 RepID=A0AAD6XQ98_9AGAR|nr:hypothetical protein B0H15DRAFT_843754 [Mycena belliae]